jgi:RHS repeat-associated protein
VPGLSDIVALAAGYEHSLALKADGTLLAWGDNVAGQIGDGAAGDSDDRDTPVAVANLAGVRAISAGWHHSLAIDGNGTLWAWGRNSNGQLGDGTLAHRYVPTQILTGVAEVAAGESHTIALKLDGTVWAWGRNFNGQVGDGTTTQRNVPTLVNAGLAQHVAAGGRHSLAMTLDGGALAWGKNDQGQLGNGTTTASANDAVTAPVNTFPSETFSTGAPPLVLPGGEPTDTEVRYFHADAIGSVRMITNESGVVVARYDYTPDGQEVNTNSQVPWNRVRFAGMERDLETGNGSTLQPLDYAGARYYQGQTGRFTRSDDAGFVNSATPQSMNLYSYTHNNPLRYIDPTGHSGECIDTKPSDCWGDDTPGSPMFNLVHRGFFENPMRSQQAQIAPPSAATLPMIMCSGSARVLKGNAGHIGKPGGFSVPRRNVPVTAAGAAIILRQWARNGTALRPYLDQISGQFPSVGASFQGIVETIGGRQLPRGFPPGTNVQDALMQLNPGKLILELPGASKDYGVTGVTLNVPSAVGCPTGTSRQ